jgi:hypothetical protein
MALSTSVQVIGQLRHDGSTRLIRVVDGWYAAKGRIEDPVGSWPHCGPLRIERFYDTFIGPRDITFGGTTRGRRHLAALLDDACAGDQIAVKRRLAAADPPTMGDGERIGTTRMVALLHGGHWDGMVRAGRTVVARAWRDGRRVVVFGSSRRDRRISVRCAYSPTTGRRDKVFGPCLTTTP